MRHNKFRFLIMIIVGFVLAIIMKAFIYTVPQNHPVWYDFSITILITILVWEGNLRIDHWLNKTYSWIEMTWKRIVIQFVVSMLFSASTIYISIFTYNYFTCCLAWKQNSLMYNSFVIGMVVSLLLLMIEISSQFFSNWKTSLVDVERYKAESAQAQLQNLKDQINPHFLFNNLSVLSSLVYKDQDKAADFINQLSKVYRYVLDSKNNELVSLESEMTFLKSYMYLVSIRFEESLRFDIHIEPEHYTKALPPMALQMLVENAIKHNEVSTSLPLTISIFSKGDSICISNPLQPRTHSESSSKMGLRNIQARYSFITDHPVIIEETNSHFSVTLPLVPKL